MWKETHIIISKAVEFCWYETVQQIKCLQFLGSSVALGQCSHEILFTCQWNAINLHDESKFSY